MKHEHLSGLHNDSLRIVELFKLSLILVFFLCSSCCNCQYLRDFKLLSIYYGKNYRLNNNFYNSYDISFEHYISSCLSSSYKGFGVRVDDYGFNNSSLSVKYFRSINRRPSFWLIPYCGISPVIFKSGKFVGLNLKPEVGVKYLSPQFLRNQLFYLTLNISYGYDIPVINETKFGIKRHDFYGRVALSTNLSSFKYFDVDKKRNNH